MALQSALERSITRLNIQMSAAARAAGGQLSWICICQRENLSVQLIFFRISKVRNGFALNLHALFSA